MAAQALRWTTSPLVPAALRHRTSARRGLARNALEMLPHRRGLGHPRVRRRKVTARRALAAALADRQDSRAHERGSATASAAGVRGRADCPTNCVRIYGERA